MVKNLVFWERHRGNGPAKCCKIIMHRQASKDTDTIAASGRTGHSEGYMKTLSGSKRTYLRGLAHHLKPVVQVGKNGVTDSFLHELNQALDTHELIKLKFNSFKEQKKTLIQEIAEQAHCEMLGLIGHIAILYRRQSDEEKRKIFFLEEMDNMDHASVN